MHSQVKPKLENAQKDSQPTILQTVSLVNTNSNALLMPSLNDLEAMYDDLEENQERPSTVPKATNKSATSELSLKGQDIYNKVPPIFTENETNDLSNPVKVIDEDTPHTNTIIVDGKNAMNENEKYINISNSDNKRCENNGINLDKISTIPNMSCKSYRNLDNDTTPANPGGNVRIFSPLPGNSRDNEVILENEKCLSGCVLVNSPKSSLSNAKKLNGELDKTNTLECEIESVNCSTQTEGNYLNCHFDQTGSNKGVSAVFYLNRAYPQIKLLDIINQLKGISVPVLPFNKNNSNKVICNESQDVNKSNSSVLKKIEGNDLDGKPHHPRLSLFEEVSIEEKRQFANQLDQLKHLVNEDVGKESKIYRGKRFLLPPTFLETQIGHRSFSNYRNIENTKNKCCVHYLKAGRPKGRVQHRSNLGKCSICLDKLTKNHVASTVCGHIFCLNCIKTSVRINGKRCPKCRKVLRGSAFHPIFI